MNKETEKTIVPNEVYNVIRALAAKLEGLAAYNKYESDAQGNSLWEQMRQQDEGAVKQLVKQLEGFFQQGKMRMA